MKCCRGSIGGTRYEANRGAARTCSIRSAHVARAWRLHEAMHDFYAILSLTGASAFVGQGSAQTLNAFERMVNRTGGIAGRPLHMIIEDDQSSPVVAVQLASQIFAKGVPAIMGPSFGATCVFVMPAGAEWARDVLHCQRDSSTQPLLRVLGEPVHQGLHRRRVSVSAGERRPQDRAADLDDASGIDGEKVALDNLKSPEFRNLPALSRTSISRSPT